MSIVPAKANLSFSIENILKEENSSESSYLSRPDDNSDNNDTITLQQGTSSPERSLNSDLPWLAYTRYCPPKIPSKWYEICVFVWILRGEHVNGCDKVEGL